MKTYLTFYILINLTFLSCAQTKEMPNKKNIDSQYCDSIFNTVIEESIFESLTKTYALSNFNSLNKIYITLTLDSSAKVIDAKINKAKTLNLSQIALIESKFLGKKICLINGDPHLLYEDFIKFGKNKYKYFCQYPYKSR